MDLNDYRKEIDQIDDELIALFAKRMETAEKIAALSPFAGPRFGVDGLPIGLQLVGDYFNEARLLHSAHRFQQATDWHSCRPADAA